MLRGLFLILLIVSVAAPAANGQAPAGPVFVHPAIRPLPSVEPPSAPAGQAPAALMEHVEATLELPPPAALWKGSAELGLDGSEGNTETFNFKFGFDAKRESEHDVFTLDFDYRKKTNQYIETANRAFLDWRFEWLLGDSPWSAFVHGTVDYDEFQSFDVRVSSDLGLGYQFIKTDSTSLAARFGGGFSHEIGGPDESYVPEAVYGLDFEHQLNKRQKLAAVVEYSPDVSEFSDFRLKTRATWELLIDEEMNLSFKFSVLDRYDSTPNGVKPNDLDYSAVLLWKF